MSEILVLIDHNEGAPRKVSLQLLTAAHQLAGETGDTVAGVWLGPGADDNAEELGKYGAQKLYVWDSEDPTAYVTLPRVDALEHLVGGGDVSAVLFPSNNHTKDVASRLAIRVAGGVISDASDLTVTDGQIVATKEVFGGDTITESAVAPGKLAILGVSNNAFAAEAVGSGAPEVEQLDLSVSDAAQRARVVSVEKQVSGERPDIAEAAFVVAGGRGLGDAEGFRLMEELADELGAGVGASRAATDAGWYPHRFQIGQTGRTISPSLYIGCGISGAIQHRAGMQTAQTIVPINKDPEAPIFSIADFGVVGDLYKVVPELIKEIKARKGE